MSEEHSLRDINLELKRRSERKNIMSSVNKVIILGHLGKDTELRYTPGGQAVTSFSVATSDKWTDKQGQKQEKTEWHNIVVWSKLAELANQYLRKGNKVYVEGKLSTRSWEDRDGTKKYKTEIVAENIVFLERNNQQQGYQAPQQQYQQPQQDYGQQPQGDYQYPQPQESFGAPPVPPEDDLPF